MTPSVGPFVENKFKVSAYGTTYHDPNDVNYGIGVGYTILGNKSAQELSNLGYGTEKFALNPIPKVQAKPNAGTSFFGFDFSLGAKFILGGEAKVKVGIAY